MRVKIPFVSRLGFLLLFSGKKKEKEPKGRPRQTVSPVSLPNPLEILFHPHHDKEKIFISAAANIQHL